MPVMAVSSTPSAARIATLRVAIPSFTVFAMLNAGDRVQCRSAPLRLELFGFAVGRARSGSSDPRL